MQRTGFALVLVLALAAALRLHGIDWGLPDAGHPQYSYHPDEPPPILDARKLVAGEIIPKHFMYGGTLHYSMLNAYIAIGRLLEPGGYNELADTLIVGRRFSAALAVLTVLLVYATGRLLFDRRAGLVAAVLLAIAPVHVILSQNVRPDAASTFLVTLLLYLSARILRADAADDRRFVILAGIALGACVALRVPLALFGIAPVAAWVLRAAPANLLDTARGAVDRRLWWLAGAAVLTYLLASPHTLMYPRALLDGLRVTWGYESGAFPDAVGRGPGIWQYGWLTLREAFGPPLYFWVLASVVFALVKRSAGQVLVLVSLLPYFVLMTTATWVVVRYTMPIVPLLALLAGAFASSALQRGGRFAAAGATAATAIVAWTLLADAAFLKVEGRRNVRDGVTAWIQQEVPPGAGLVTVWQYAADVYPNPVVPKGYQRLLLLLFPPHDPRELADATFDYLILNETVYRNMERLGDAHPYPRVRQLRQLMVDTRLELVREFVEPVTLFGLDFSGQFTSQDYVIVNPGIRVYRHGPS